MVGTFAQGGKAGGGVVETRPSIAENLANSGNPERNDAVSTAPAHPKAAVASLDRLAELIRSIEGKDQPINQRAVQLGWGDDRIPLLSGRLHEWIGVDDCPDSTIDDENPAREGDSVPTKVSRRSSNWTPPLLILAHLARQILLPLPLGESGGEGERAESLSFAPDQHSNYNTNTSSPQFPASSFISSSQPSSRSLPVSSPSSLPSLILWIGRRIWPHPRILADRAAIDRTLLSQSIFIDTPDLPSHVWAIDLALRSPAVIIVIADGSGLRLPHTRRLQLAAENSIQKNAGRGETGGVGGWLLLARPPWELSQRSAAVTRWFVQRARSPDQSPCFCIKLLRCKGTQRVTAAEADAHWFVDWNRETGRIHPSSALADRSRSSAHRQIAG